MKYDKAFDSKLNKWVVPEDIDIADRYDKPRFFSVNTREEGKENSGDILTYVKECEVKGKKKNDKYNSNSDEPEYLTTLSIRHSHFRKYCDNTRELRDKVDRQVKAQESIVHKLAKSLAKDIKYIRIPSIRTDLIGEDYEIITEQVIKVNFIACEKKDETTGRIPDIIFETEYLGVKEKLYLEIFYKHPVEQNKKLQFQYYGINCLEVDISDLRDNLELSEESLKKKIKDAIENRCYWISNSYKKCFEIARDSIIADINTSNILRKSRYYNNLNSKCYLFRDDYYSLTKRDCICESEDKSVNIGDCNKCKNCIYIRNKDSNNIEGIHIYCLEGNVEYDKYNFVRIINSILKESKEHHIKNISDDNE